MKKKLVIAVLGAVVITTAILAWYRYDQLREARQAPLRPPAPKSVEVEPVSRGTIHRWITGEGTARAVRREFLTFQQAGKVVYIAADSSGNRLREGSRVEGPSPANPLGDLLAQIDRRDYQQSITVIKAELATARQQVRSAEAEVNQNRTELDLVRKHVARSKILHAKGAYSDSALEHDRAAVQKAEAALASAEATLEGAQAQISAIQAKLEQARIAMERTAIFAPFSGVIGYINIREGDLVSPQAVDTSSEEQRLKTTPIILIDPSAFEITLDLPLDDGLQVHPGQEGLVVTPYLREMAARGWLEARVHSVTPAVTPQSRTILVKLRTTREATGLLDGMYVVARIAVTRHENVLLIPNRSLIYEDSIPYALVVEANGQLSRRRLVTGIEGDRMTEIIEGVQEGERVVTRGGQGLSQGELVTVHQQNGGDSE